jgi:hypothetical protein
MGKYLINGSKYEIDDSIQGDELYKTLRSIARQGAPSSGRPEIDAYLDETDDMLGLTPGTSARQIHQESKFDPRAVSPRGARGLAQVMPDTLESLSKRMKRKLDPHNERDAIEMHRELMRENMAKWGNEDDALRAYNAGWTPAKWNNPETRQYLEIIKGKQAKDSSGAPIPRPAEGAPKAPYVPYAQVREKVDPATLKEDQDWLRASKQLYSMRERKSFTGTDEDLAEWGKDFMGYFNSNMVDMARYAADLARNGTEEDKRAFLFLMDTYDNTEWSWEGAGRAAKGIFTDPTNLVGLATLGVGTAGKVMASAAAKQGVKRLLLQGLGRTGLIAGADAAIIGAAENSIRQGVEVTAGRREEVSLSTVAGHAAMSAAAGTVLGTAGDAAFTAIAGVVRRASSRFSASRAARQAPGSPVEARVEPTLGELAPAGAGASTAPGEASVGVPAARTSAEALPASSAVPNSAGLDLVPERVLTDAEIAAATARKQEGRQWVDDLPPVEPANPAAAARIEMPDANTGLRSTPRSMEELTADGQKIADQLRALDDKTMHGVLESFRQGSLPLEDTRIIARGVQIHADELRVEQAEVIKKLGLSTNAQETVRLMDRLAAVEDRLVPLNLADDAFGSMAGSMLRQRQEGLPGMQGVTVESLMAQRGLSLEEAQQTYVRLVQGSMQDAQVQSIQRSYDGRISAALQSGDLLEASMLSAMRQREMAAVVETELPGSASFMAKATELVISNIFTPTTVAINLVPAAVKTLVLPFAKAMVSNPLLRSTRAEVAASYGAMRSTVGAAFRAAVAAYRYEQSLITRGTGRILEGEMALTGRAAGYVRFFPRVLNATDEFLAQINYASFVSGRAAADAATDGAARGLSGDALTAHIRQATEQAMENAYAQRSGEALIQPLVNKGVNLGLTGEDLLQYVEREAMRDPDALRHGADETALDLVRDVLYKRKFSGEGAASNVAQSYEKMMNQTPTLKLVLGQLFFRTPIRVFEEGIRLTPGLQFLAPKFMEDLAGTNGTLRQARAQAEALTSIAIAGAVFNLYASGAITGDGAYDNWKAQRTAGDGPGQAPYTIRMADGSTWSYRNFDPVATPFKIIVNGLERMDKLAIRQAQGEFIEKSGWDQALAFVTTGTMAIAAALRDANLVAGVDQMIKFGENLADPEGKDDAWVKMFGEKLALLVPNTLHKLAKQNDPTIKDPADFWQVVETRLAALHVDREDIKTSYSYDVLGNPRRITDTGTLWNIFSVSTPEERAKGHSEEAQTVMLELDRLQKETGAVFSPPMKHRMTGDFDLRTVLTADKKETLYDRWQANYRALEPDRILHPILTAPMPDGTFKHKATRVETVNKVMSELRDAAFMQMVAQEQAVIDRVIKLEIDKARAASGMLDFSNRSK